MKQKGPFKGPDWQPLMSVFPIILDAAGGRKDGLRSLAERMHADRTRPAGERIARHGRLWSVTFRVEARLVKAFWPEWTFQPEKNSATVFAPHNLMGRARGMFVSGKVEAQLIEVRADLVKQYWPQSRKTNVASSDKGGRPSSVDWDVVEDALTARIVEMEGLPSRDGSKGWQVKADAIRWVEELLSKRHEDAAFATIRTHVSKIFDDFQKKNLT